jgi:cell division protein FtsW (lipid II flippase)
LAQLLFLVAILILYQICYPSASRLIVHNMCMLIVIGWIMITRLSYTKALRQFFFVVFGAIVGLILPILIRKIKGLSRWGYIYAAIGLTALIAVVLLGQISGGAKLGFTIAGFGVQPSEFVKILYVFFVASAFSQSTRFKDLVRTTIFAAAHVLILVLSTDLGAALILFVVYLVMLYVATRNLLYAGAGIAAGSVAAVLGYHMFAHIKTRVQAWQDPFATYQDGGYQVAQSLFAIGTGSWFGMGLYQGLPDSIPVAEEDFIFSAISEELGLIFALCLILVCLSCYVMFLNIAMSIRNHFYKLLALGLGTCYIFQVFLTIGGVTKFIPSTGVTLPLVSYGGSSVLSTMMMFGIIQGLYILREDEEETIEKRRERQIRRNRPSGREDSFREQKKQGQRERGKETFEEVPQHRVRHRDVHIRPSVSSPYGVHRIL